MKSPFLLALVLVLVLAPGCASTKHCAATDQACLDAARQLELERWAADLRDIASLGVPIALEDNPDLRSGFEHAVTGLRALESSDGLTVDGLLAVLRESGIQEIDSPKGRLYVTAGTIVIRRVVGEHNLQTPDEVKLFAAALREGIELGLGR